MRTQMITACCVLSLANFAVAANPTHRLRPNDADALKAARINVSCKILNGTDYAFEISAGVPQGFDSLDASFSVRNDKGLVTYTSWSSSERKCIAIFMVGEQALKDAWFGVQLYIGDKLKPFSASGGYALKLSEFAEARGIALFPPSSPPKEDFEMTSPIRKDGSTLTIAVKKKPATSNRLYDLHVAVAGRSEQHFDVRNGQPITRQDIRLVDLNGDSYLDIMIVGGTDDRDKEWYKTLVYNKDKQEYRWLTD